MAKRHHRQGATEKVPVNETARLGSLIARRIGELTNDDDALTHIGQLIDAALDHGSSVGVARAFELLEQLRSRTMSAVHEATAHYFAANAWDAKRLQRNAADPFAWEQPEVQSEILELRKATRHAGFSELPCALRCRILTNLGNQLSFIGRCIEAAEVWHRAVSEDGRFGMALGNLGVGLTAYARQLHDRGQGLAMVAAAQIGRAHV